MVAISIPLLGVTTDEILSLSFSPFINAGAPIVANASPVDFFVYDVPSFDVVISSARPFQFLVLSLTFLKNTCSDTFLKKNHTKLAPWQNEGNSIGHSVAYIKKSLSWWIIHFSTHGRPSQPNCHLNGISSFIPLLLELAIENLVADCI
jgi:hypothetical protein